MSRSACPRCGARLAPDLPWCSLCLAPLGAGSAVPATGPAVPATAPAAHAVVQDDTPGRAAAEQATRAPGGTEVEAAPEAPRHRAGQAGEQPDMDAWFDELRRQSPAAPEGWAGRLAGASRGLRALIAVSVMTGAFAVLTLLGSLMS